jgi:hypothetical protein
MARSRKRPKALIAGILLLPLLLLARFGSFFGGGQHEEDAAGSRTGESATSAPRPRDRSSEFSALEQPLEAKPKEPKPREEKPREKPSRTESLPGSRPSREAFGERIELSLTTLRGAVREQDALAARLALSALEETGNERALEEARKVFEEAGTPPPPRKTPAVERRCADLVARALDGSSAAEGAEAALFKRVRALQPDLGKEIEKAKSVLRESAGAKVRAVFEDRVIDGRVQRVEERMVVLRDLGEAGGRFPSVSIGDVDPSGLPGVEPVAWAWFLASMGLAREAALALPPGRKSEDAAVLRDLLAHAET